MTPYQGGCGQSTRISHLREAHKIDSVPGSGVRGGGDGLTPFRPLRGVSTHYSIRDDALTEIDEAQRGKPSYAACHSTCMYM